MHRELVSDDVGTAKINPDTPTVVNSRRTWKIVYRAGKKGIKQGGSVRITIPHGFSLPQDKAFFDPGYVTVEFLSDEDWQHEKNTSVEPVEFSLTIISDIFCRMDPKTGHSGAWGRNIFVKILNRDLKPGEGFELTYGNRDYYGYEPFSHAGAISRELSGEAQFIVAVDPDGKRDAPFSGYIRLRECPSITLHPKEPIHHHYLFVDPNIPPEQESVSAKLLPVDRFNNPFSVKEVCLNRTSHFDSHYFHLSLGHVSVRSNPILFSSSSGGISIPPCFKGLSLYWGDIHGHTIHSDGLGSLEDYYSFARNIASLDFSAVTDHDDIGPRLSEEEWILTQQSAEKFNEPGKFVTFLGHEYRNGKCDMNIYFPSNEGKVFYGNSDLYRDPKNLIPELLERNAMIIPHMHFGVDFSGFDDRIYRIMEIYSSHGCAEFPGCKREIPYLRRQIQKSNRDNSNAYFQKLLLQGYHLGACAGSDTHSGRPGFSDWTRVTRTYIGGLTAVYCKEKTRESIWDALYDRLCYATTGNRSILFFDVNGVYPMGSEISSELFEGEPFTLHSAIIADGSLKEVTIYRKGEVIYHKKIKGSLFECSLTEDVPEKETWYYVRFDLENGEMVWSSPVWII